MAREPKLPQNLAEIVLIVDRSGSMFEVRDDTIGGVNSLIDKNRKAHGDAVLSLVLFNESSKVVYDRVDIREVRPLTPADYAPSGCTALLDAVGGAIKRIRNVQRYMPEGYRPERTVFAIATDGYENASRDYTYQQVKALIEEQTAAGWEILFLGANIDVAAEAGKLGVASGRAVEFACDAAGSAVAYAAVGDALCAMRAGEQLGGDWCAPIEADMAARRPVC